VKPCIGDGRLHFLDVRPRHVLRDHTHRSVNPVTLPYRVDYFGVRINPWERGDFVVEHDDVFYQQQLGVGEFAPAVFHGTLD